MTDGTAVIEADLTWTGERFERGIAIEIDTEGKITAPREAGTPKVTRRLTGRALLPGLINAHSHAFQRGLRGRGERFPKDRGSFWTWRGEMYDLVGTMDAARLYAICRQAFDEMLRAGITTVGEFHYLHHDGSHRGYAFDAVVLRAAREAGIRLVLLDAYYATGGIGEPLAGAQRHFETPTVEAYWARFDELAKMLDPRTQTLGVVAHSIRAAPIEAIAELHEEAERRALVFHMHVEEQLQEIEDCVRHYHRPPLALLNERLQITPRFTAVHCTHSAPEDMADFIQAGGNVCICPLTEANLGDGIADVPAILRRYGRICLGSDSNARISMLEEMRWLEYVQRLRTQSRGVCVDEAGRAGRALLATATANGAHALGLRAGALRPGHHADFFTIDLQSPDLAGWTEETLLDALVLGAGNRVIGVTCVGGRWVDGEG